MTGADKILGGTRLDLGAISVSAVLLSQHARVARIPPPSSSSFACLAPCAQRASSGFPRAAGREKRVEASVGPAWRTRLGGYLRVLARTWPGSLPGPEAAKSRHPRRGAGFETGSRLARGRDSSRSDPALSASQWPCEDTSTTWTTPFRLFAGGEAPGAHAILQVLTPRKALPHRPRSPQAQQRRQSRGRRGGAHGASTGKSKHSGATGSFLSRRTGWRRVARGGAKGVMHGTVAFLSITQRSSSISVGCRCVYSAVLLSMISTARNVLCFEEILERDRGKEGGLLFGLDLSSSFLALSVSVFPA